MLNICIIHGRLVSDAKKYIDPNTDFPKAFFTLVSSSVAKGANFPNEITTYIDCACNLEFVSKKALTLKQGDEVTIRGSLRNNNKPDIKKNIVVLDVAAFEHPGTIS